MRRCLASLLASEAAMISASHDESDTEGCFVDAHKMAALQNMNT